MHKLSNHTALKEWANVVDAIGDGRQIILIRKGGIADRDFGIDAERFYLYPTFFHQGEQEPRSRAEIASWAEVVKVWTLRDAAVLHQLEPFVVMPRETLLARYRFRPDQALHIIAVRGWRLPAPVTIPFESAYGGCVSWISLNDEIDVSGSHPVLAPSALDARIREIESVLAQAAPR